MRLRAAALAFIVSTAAAHAAAPWQSDVRAALQRAHFSYPMGRDEVTLRRVGEIGRRYVVVDYIWSESWHSARVRRGGFPRGVQRLLIFERKGAAWRYLGHYAVDAKPVGIAGNKILFDARRDEGDEIVFGPGGPPLHAWVDGENPTFDTRP
jgi:hypothetical protein